MDFADWIVVAVLAWGALGLAVACAFGRVARTMVSPDELEQPVAPSACFSPNMEQMSQHPGN